MWLRNHSQFIKIMLKIMVNKTAYFTLSKSLKNRHLIQTLKHFTEISKHKWQNLPYLKIRILNLDKIAEFVFLKYQITVII